MLVWDERKREANLIKHGFDFEDAHYVYFDPHKFTDDVVRHGELRHIDVAFGTFAGMLVALVYTKRGFDIRVISLRPASRKERYEYEQDRLGES